MLPQKKKERIHKEEIILSLDQTLSVKHVLCIISLQQIQFQLELHVMQSSVAEDPDKKHK